MVLVALMLTSIRSFAATEFNMSFSTAAPGGSYAQKNVVVVWVTQADGTFVKTILRYANSEKGLLSTWKAAAGTSDADAVLGATRANHSAPVTMTATWDLKNKSGTVVPDGTYKINFEMTDGARVTHSFNFVKNSTAGTRTDSGTAYFKNISIAYAPPVPPNTAPVAQSQSVTNAEDTAKVITLRATDAETNALTYAIVTGPSHGTLSAISGNMVTYFPATNYFGADSFTFKANDGIADSAPATVSITVTPVNDPPVAQNQRVSVLKDVAKTITLVATDIENNPLTYTVLSSPSHGVLSGSAPNLTYTPATNYTGPDSFTFKANDGMTDSAPATVSITVAVNNPPVANDQSVSADRNTAKAITLTASDAEGDPLTYTIAANPAHGNLSGIPQSPYVTYTPATNYTGPDSFTFSAFDGISTGNIATVSITVTVPQYALTVNSGTGSGSYTNGTRVTISANVKAGQAFTRWTGDVQYIASVTSSLTVVTMPAGAISLTATYVIDTTKPTLKIASPMAKAKIVATNGLFTVRGTAVDKLALANVLVQLNGGTWTNAITTNSWKNWSLPVMLMPGTNTIRAYSVDSAVNNSSTATVVFTYAPGAVMQVQTNGAGTVTPAYNGLVLEIGKSYKMTAKAVAKASIFTNWTYGISGPVATNKTIITFVMQSNLVLTANFRSLLAPAVALASVAAVAPATPQAAIVVDGSAKDWANIPRSSFSYASVTQEVAAALSGNNIALLLTGCPFGTSDTVLVYFKLRLSYGIGDVRHSVDLWTSGSVLYGMVDGQVITGLEAVLLNGVLEVKLPVDQAPSQVTIEEIGCGMDLGGGTLTELFRLIPPSATTP